MQAGGQRFESVILHLVIPHIAALHIAVSEQSRAATIGQEQYGKTTEKVKISPRQTAGQDRHPAAVAAGEVL